MKKQSLVITGDISHSLFQVIVECRSHNRLSILSVELLVSSSSYGTSLQLKSPRSLCCSDLSSDFITEIMAVFVFFFSFIVFIQNLCKKCDISDGGAKNIHIFRLNYLLPWIVSKLMRKSLVMEVNFRPVPYFSSTNPWVRRQVQHLTSGKWRRLSHNQSRYVEYCEIQYKWRTCEVVTDLLDKEKPANKKDFQVYCFGVAISNIHINNQADHLPGKPGNQGIKIVQGKVWENGSSQVMELGKGSKRCTFVTKLIVTCARLSKTCLEKLRNFKVNGEWSAPWWYCT